MKPSTATEGNSCFGPWNCTTGLCWCLLASLLSGNLMADEFRLRDGRILVGNIISSKKIQRTDPIKNVSVQDFEITVEIAGGVQCVVLKSDIQENGYRKDAEVEVKLDSKKMSYDEIAKTMEQTAEAHYELARRLFGDYKELSKAHFQRALEFDPDHAESRSALHYKISESGRWERVEDRMLRQGKVEVKPFQFDYPELIANKEQKAEYDRRKGAINAEIAKLTGPKGGQALANLENQNDPLVAELVAAKLTKEYEKMPELLKRTLMELLAKYSTGEAIRALTIVALYDPTPAFRNLAIDLISKNGRTLAVYLLIDMLKSLSPIKSEPRKINAIAYVLGKLDAKEAILPLADKLVTKIEVQTSSGGTNASTDGTFSTGGPTKMVQDVQNADVQGALSQITGQGRLGYDRTAWLRWYASINDPPVDDLRRDP
jgi:hypothetical protein